MWRVTAITDIRKISILSNRLVYVSSVTGWYLPGGGHVLVTEFLGRH